MSPLQGGMERWANLKVGGARQVEQGRVVISRDADAIQRAQKVERLARMRPHCGGVAEKDDLVGPLHTDIL